MREKQLEFPFMEKDSNSLKVGIRYKGFAYRGTKSLERNEDKNIFEHVTRHVLVGPNGEEVPYIKKGRQEDFESAKDFQDYIDMLIEVAPPL
tara:strand:- start:256 stop:531 length:276 start_codon:yes stop_codon:yes gene_type:complete